MESVRDFEHSGWQRAAPVYAASFARITALFVGALLDAAEIAPGARVLDIACGPGQVSDAARIRGAEAAGVDFSAAMIAQARAQHPAIAFREADAERLPFEDASFDAAICNFGVHHFENPARALGEARRVLRPGGRFAFTLWARPQDNTPWRILRDAIAAAGDARVLAPAANEARIQREALLATARAAGFADVTETELDRIWRLPRDADLAALFETSTVRLAALLQRQTPAAREAIRVEVARMLGRYADGDATALPTRAVVIAARAPSPPG
jgi:ubiquinone/menaquinone biosynthesis C-methylase UbiE